MGEKLDIIIKNGSIVDGTGKDMYKDDIGIKDGKIVKIGKLDDCSAERAIDGEGLIVSPGFIDMHSHGEMTILMFPKAESSIKQGITTMVGGNCGISPAPLEGYWLMQFWEFDFWDEIQPYIFYQDAIQPAEKAKEVIKKKFGVDIKWSTFKEFLDCVDERGASINFVPLVGHGQIRAQVMGMDSSRQATDEEIEKMAKYIREAMESGAFGMSTGLDYAPGAYANTEEIVKLAKVVKEYGGMYATHWRRTGVRKGTPKRPKKIKGIEEALEVGKRANIKVQISHLASGYEIYPEPAAALERASAQATLDVIDQAVKEGVDVAFDVIPNTSGGIGTAVYFITYFAPWLNQAGSVEQFAKNLLAQDLREHIKEFIISGRWYAINPKVSPDWDREIIILGSKNKDYEGKTLSQIAEDKNKDALDLFIDIIIEDPFIKGKREFMNEEWVKVFLKHPRSMVCTDSFAFDDKGVWGLDTEIPCLLPHPNTYCAFPRYITTYGEGRIEDTIRRITGFPAEWLGITDRGVIKEGACADIVIFDREGFKTNENYVETRNYPDGIDYVIVNGKLVVDKGTHTGELAGKVIRMK
ncbi:MAG: D-aminoacylase [Firmicutes bacterium]|nr:D-aminoacylase [Bacillota bacterium]NSW91961.1 D-aminoacylase [Bacillota bacterium]